MKYANTVRNPLTVIAIFAGLVEVSASVVLPLVGEDIQKDFVWFLIFFPTLLVVLFFITLNFNNKVFYAPSDYTDENNYVTLNYKSERQVARLLLNTSESELKSYLESLKGAK